MCKSQTPSPSSKAIVNELRAEQKRQQATMEPSYDEFRDEAARLTTIIERLVDDTIRTAWNPDGWWAAGEYPAELAGPHGTVLEAITAALEQEADDGS